MKSFGTGQKTDGAVRGNDRYCDKQDTIKAAVGSQPGYGAIGTDNSSRTGRAGARRNRKQKEKVNKGRSGE